VALRLLDLTAGLSRLADLGFGLPPGESLRSAALASLFAASLDLDDHERGACLHAALLRHVGCTGHAHETAELFGDEFATTLAAERTDRAAAWDVASTLVPELVRGRSRRDQVRVAATALTRGARFGRAFDTTSCELGMHAAARLGLPEDVQRSLYHGYEWWNGRGVPQQLAGDAIPVGSRVASLTSVAVRFHALDGVDAAVTAVRRRAGGILDPGLAARFADQAEALLDELDGWDPLDVVLDGEPRPVSTVLEPRVRDVALVFADLADVKTPTLHGHSRGVAALARTAGTRLELPAREVDELELAGLLHDVGRVAISAAVWAHPGPLDASRWEQVRLHAYHSERVLAGSARLAPSARLVGLHHERADGSGYHRGAVGRELPLAASVLAAADAFDAMTHDRPHRRAMTREQATDTLVAAAERGQLDVDAVRAVVDGVEGAGRPIRRVPPAGLTDREVEVLRLVADGCSNRQIAERLVISRRTAEFHVQSIYRKLGTSSRAAAAVFAMHHDLLER
jgi:HD-GYP domain-containing protein (c-di-GMP phosphodiesterase class II)